MSRGKSDAFNTIRSKSRALMCIYTWADINGVDLETRFSKGELLSLAEIDSICDSMKHEYKFIKKLGDESEKVKTKKNQKIFQLNFKLNESDIKYVSNDTYNFRLMYITKYLDWLVSISMSNISRNGDLYATTMIAKDEMIYHLNARKRPSKSDVEVKGFDDDVQNMLIEIVDSDNPSNPFENKFVKIRNQIFILLSLCTGLRRGEMLKLKVEDFDVATKSLKIIKIKDDPVDPRNIEPSVKTKGRMLELEDIVVFNLLKYLNLRSKIRKARTHPFLFVSKYGKPLSYTSAGDIYITLRQKILNLPDDLSQHAVRHRWNENFSEIMQNKYAHLSETEIDNYRKFLMGWSSASKMPDRYNKKFIRKQAGKVSLEIQKEILKHRGN